MQKNLEEAEIQQQVSDDPDNFEADEEFFARAVPASPEMYKLTEKYKNRTRD